MPEQRADAAHRTAICCHRLRLLRSQHRKTVAGLRPLRKQRFGFDHVTIILLLLVWILVAASCIILLVLAEARVGADDSQGMTRAATPVIASTIVWTLAAILNETLTDRCWRRISSAALDKGSSSLDDAQMAHHLRAANFEWPGFLARLFRCRATVADMRASLSYCLLRFGTTFSFSTIQYGMSWPEGQHEPVLRYRWAVLPIVIHAVCIVACLAVWLLPPWKLWSSQYDDVCLLRRYQPYLQRVTGGSVASHEAVAQILLHPNSEMASTRLGRDHAPGMQVLAKLKGVWCGIVMVNLPPVILILSLLGRTNVTQSTNDSVGVRFALLSQHTTYTFALDFVVWNLSLEGLTKIPRRSSPRHHLNHLGYSSGLMLLLRALKQRRPLRAFVFLWLFWLQAAVVRTYIAGWTVVGTRNLYTDGTGETVMQSSFWLIWLGFLAIFIMPLFLVWLVMPFQSPICRPSGWIWAQVAQGATYGPGNWGLRDGMASWGLEVDSFARCRLA